MIKDRECRRTASGVPSSREVLAAIQGLLWHPLLQLRCNETVFSGGCEVRLGLEFPCPLVPVSLVTISAHPRLPQGTWPVIRATTQKGTHGFPPGVCNSFIGLPVQCSLPIIGHFYRKQYCLVTQLILLSHFQRNQDS